MNKQIHSTVVVSSVILAFTTCTSALLAQEDASTYIGTKMCGACHKKDDTGNQLAKWQASAHAKAFEILASPEAKEVAKKAGVEDAQKSGKCLACHSTAYLFSEEKKLEKPAVEEGVTCESCHGGGKNYKAKETMQDRQKSIAGGMIYPATKNCERCHNDKSPTWKADRYTTKDGKKVGFDLEQAEKKIEHPNPAAKH